MITGKLLIVTFRRNSNLSISEKVVLMRFSSVLFRKASVIYMNELFASKYGKLVAFGVRYFFLELETYL